VDVNADEQHRSPDEDASELDLTPRTAAGRDVSARSPRARRLVGVGVLVVVLGVAGFAVAQALNEASLFFRHVDEAVAMRDELGAERFRIHGIVEPGSVVELPGAVTFAISYNGVVVEVDHTGDPVEMFAADMPLVLEGHWQGQGDDLVFVSDRMLAKHDEVYIADHSDRVEDYDDSYGNGYQDSERGETSP
jgi:cytochrome c-type biogenesis protein CcmE